MARRRSLFGGDGGDDGVNDSDSASDWAASEQASAPRSPTSPQLSPPDAGAADTNSPFSISSNHDDGESETKGVRPTDDDDTEVRTRPRFHGDGGTWRRNNRSPIRLTASLEQAEGGNLAIHLYNAFMLKRRHYSSTYDNDSHDDDDQDAQAQESRAESAGARKRRKIHSFSTQRKSRFYDHGQVDDNNNTNDDGNDDNVRVIPSKHWTAWPLPPDQVPRPDEQFRAAKWSSPSPSPPPDDTTTANVNTSADATAQPPPQSASADLASHLLSLLQRLASARWRARPREESDIVYAATPRRQVGFTAAEARERAWKERQLLPAPVELADDDFAARLAGPFVRSVLAQLDGLLGALRVEREGFWWSANVRARAGMKTTKSTRSEDHEEEEEEGEEEEEDGGSDAEAERAGKGKGRGRPKKKKEVGKAKKQKWDPSSKHKVNPRDWSSVLGTALLIPGPPPINPVAVHRAIERCAALFQESMLVRTLEEQPLGFQDGGAAQTAHKSLQSTTRKASRNGKRTRLRLNKGELLEYVPEPIILDDSSSSFSDDDDDNDADDTEEPAQQYDQGEERLPGAAGQQEDGKVAVDAKPKPSQRRGIPTEAELRQMHFGAVHVDGWMRGGRRHAGWKNG